MATRTYDGPRADLGVIGGSGLYALLDGDQVELDTPFGPPSDPLTIARSATARSRSSPGTAATTGSRRTGSTTAPTSGRCARSACARCSPPARSGRCKAEQGPGTIVVPDQVVDRTWGRGHTFFDDAGPVVHVAFADPYCPNGRRVALSAGRDRGLPVVDGGTLVVVNGPRFSSRAESLWHQAQGWSVVGMTAVPEAALARELGLCLTSVALVTDLDAGLEHGEGVTHEEVLRVFAENISDRPRAAGRRGRPRCPRPTPTARAGTRSTARSCPFDLP